LHQERKLLKGLENIKNVYVERYKDDPEHKGMNGLNHLYGEMEKRSMSMAKNTKH